MWCERQGDVKSCLPVCASEGISLLIICSPLNPCKSYSKTDRFRGHRVWPQDCMLGGKCILLTNFSRAAL